MRFAHAALAAGVMLGSFTAKHVAAEDICKDRSGSVSYTITNGEVCSGTLFGKSLCSVDCPDGSVGIPTIVASIPKKMIKASAPRVVADEGKTAQSRTAFTEEEINLAISEMSDRLSSEEQGIIQEVLKRWRMLRFHADRIGRKYNRRIDPKFLYHVAIADEIERGEHGDAGGKMITSRMAKFMYGIHGKWYKHYRKGEAHDLGENGVINYVAYFSDGTVAFGCEKLGYNEIPDEYKRNIYRFLITSSIRRRAAEQTYMARFDAATQYMWTYEFIDRMTAVR